MSIASEDIVICLSCGIRLRQPLDLSNESKLPNLFLTNQGAGPYCFKCVNQPNEPSITMEAEKLIHGERRDDYGDMDESFQNIADVWSAILTARTNCDSNLISKGLVALMMTGLKLVREANKHKRDNLVDVCGYALCLSEMHDDDKHN